MNASMRVHFSAKGEKDDNFANFGSYSGPIYDKSREQYTFDYGGEIPKDPKFLKQATCHVFVALKSQIPPFNKRMAAAKASFPSFEGVKLLNEG